jgi:hypothetical protein
MIPVLVLNRMYRTHNDHPATLTTSASGGGQTRTIVMSLQAEIGNLQIELDAVQATRLGKELTALSRDTDHTDTIGWPE